MKDSWEKVKLDELGKHYGGLTNKTKDDFGRGKPYIPYLNIFTNGKVDKDDLELVDVKNNEHQNKVKKGDLFFTTSSETPHEVGMTSVLIDDIGEAYLNSFCFGFRLDNFERLLPEFAVHLFRGKEVRKTISDLAQGSTRYNLSKSIFFEKLYLNLPPLPQQRKIAQILSTVDAVLEKTEAAIAKYQQLKQGLMHDVFTRGIDTNTGQLRPKQTQAPELYKQSALGWIPKEWEVDKIENVSSLVTNGFVGVATPFYTTRDSGVLYLFGTNIRANYLDFRDTRYVTKEFHLKQRKSNLQKGDMLTVQSGHIGTSAVIPENFGEVNCHALIITRFNDTIVNSKFISYYFNSSIGIKFLEKLFIGSTIKHINTSDLSKHIIPIPNIVEQNEIVLKLSDIQNSINVEQQALAKYQQLKAGLLQDLLTGKVAVNV